MQDGYIFSGSIARNIALGGENIDPLRLKTAVQLASLSEYLEALPNGLHTLVGAEGQGLSGGQKQRILLARSIYRMPDFLFLDEATSALDARTETAVYVALREFAAGRTVVVIAHRLSHRARGRSDCRSRSRAYRRAGNACRSRCPKRHLFPARAQSARTRGWRILENGQPEINPDYDVPGGSRAGKSCVWPRGRTDFRGGPCLPGDARSGWKDFS